MCDPAVRTCLACVHCRLNLGEKDYESTPGEPGSLACAKGHFDETGGYLGTAEAWKLLTKAETCTDFTVAPWADGGMP